MKCSKKSTLFLFLIFHILFISCNKLEIIESPENSEISLFKNQFYKDSRKYKKLDINRNFRQSLERIILWENYHKSGDTVYVPMKLKYPEEINTPNGSLYFENQTWLCISNKDENYDYTMYTLIQDSTIQSKRFSGTLLIEDFFKGGVNYTKLLDGELDLPKLKKMITKSGKGGNIDKKSVVQYETCEYVKTGTTCVGGINNGDVPPICTTNYEKVCNLITLPDMPDIPWISGGDGGGGSGNTGGSSQTDTTRLPNFIILDSLNNDQMNLLRIWIDETDENCAGKLLLNSVKNLKITFIPVDGMHPKFRNDSGKRIILSDPYSFQVVTLMNHEVFHSKQDEMLMGTIHKYAKIKDGNGIKYPDGLINIEFEQMFFNDVENALRAPWNVGQLYHPDNDNESSKVYRNIYKNYIQSFVKRTDLASFINSSEFENNYFKLMREYKQYTTTEHSYSKIDTLLKPKTLKELLKNGLCP